MGKWDDLLQFLYGCCQSQQASHREVGYFVVHALLDVVAETLMQHLPHLIALFERGLNDPESKEVKKSTIRALGRLAEMIEPEDDASIVGNCACTLSLMLFRNRYVSLFRLW